MTNCKFYIVGIVKENGKWREKRVSKFFDTKYAAYKAKRNGEFESCFNSCVRSTRTKWPIKTVKDKVVEVPVTEKTAKYNVTWPLILEHDIMILVKAKKGL